MQFDTMPSALGAILFARDDNGISRVQFLDSPKPMPVEPHWKKTGGDSLLMEAGRQLKEYFDGRRRTFSLPLSLDGTEFQKQVWKGLLTIPYGSTWSYKDLAEAIGRPTALRAVGNANGKNKIAIIVPCHRVIGSSGGLVGFASGLERKRYLISLEQSV